MALYVRVRHVTTHDALEKYHISRVLIDLIINE